MSTPKGTTSRKPTWWRNAALTIATLAALAAPAWAADGSWTTGTPAPSERSEVAVTAEGNLAYLIGDYNGATELLIYDMAADRWSTGPALPHTVHHPQAAVADGKVYLLGGYAEGWNPSAEMFVFDPASSAAWQPAGTMPTPRGAGAAVQFDGKLFLVGGIGPDGTNTPLVDILDLASGQWTAGAPMPTPRDHIGAGIIDGHIIVAGGRKNGDPGFNLTNTEIYDPATDSWAQAASMPTARSGVAAAALDGTLYVFGGETRQDTFGEAEGYAFAGDSWSSFAPLPTPRHGFGAAAYDGRVFTLTGSPVAGAGKSNLVEIFTPGG